MKQQVLPSVILIFVAHSLVSITAAQSAELSRDTVALSAGPLTISDCQPTVPIGGCFVPPQQPATRQTIDILPDQDGEADGDPAPICATWDAAVLANATNGGVAAAAAGGGSADAFASPPDTAQATTEGAAYVEINGGDPKPLDGSEEGLGESLGVTSPPDGPDPDTRISSVFFKDTRIGDQIQISVSAAAAVTAPEGGSAEASASSRVTLRFGPCEPLPPVTQVPTMSQWSLILTALLLAALGYLGLRHRQE